MHRVGIGVFLDVDWRREHAFAQTFQPAKQIGIELIEHAIDLLLQMHHRMRIANQAHGFHLLCNGRYLT
jgi:hypothetical protein